MIYLHPTAQRVQFHWARYFGTVFTTIMNSSEYCRWRVKWTGKADILQEKWNERSCYNSIFPAWNIYFHCLLSSYKVIK